MDIERSSENSIQCALYEAEKAARERAEKRSLSQWARGKIHTLCRVTIVGQISENKSLEMHSDEGDSKLRWRCRRGMLELDELLLGYLERGYGAASPDEKGAFLELLQCADQELFDLFFAGKKPADPRLNHVIDQIRRNAGA